MKPQNGARQTRWQRTARQKETVSLTLVTLVTAPCSHLYDNRVSS
jgi:hypothetical protein